jgi:hypothetical protein
MWTVIMLGRRDGNGSGRLGNEGGQDQLITVHCFSSFERRHAKLGEAALVG